MVPNPKHAKAKPTTIVKVIIYHIGTHNYRYDGVGVLQFLYKQLQRLPSV
jgi:hypothetical protein